MIIPSGFSGLGDLAGLGATPRKTTKITLDPIVIEGKIPDAAAAKPFPWKWVALAGGLAGLYLLAKHAGKGRRGPLAVARG